MPVPYTYHKSLQNPVIYTNIHKIFDAIDTLTNTYSRDIVGFIHHDLYRKSTKLLQNPKWDGRIVYPFKTSKSNKRAIIEMELRPLYLPETAVFSDSTKVNSSDVVSFRFFGYSYHSEEIIQSTTYNYYADACYLIVMKLHYNGQLTQPIATITAPVGHIYYPENS